MAALIADVANRQHRLSGNGVLHANAVLVANRQFVIVHGQPGKVGSVNRQCCGCTRGESKAWVSHLNVSGIDLQAKGNIGTGVVHVVALNALVHDAESAADNSLAPASQIVGKAKTRTEGRPVIVHQTLWNAVLAGYANAVQVELLGNDWIGARAEAGTGGGATGISRPAADMSGGVEGCCIRRVIERGIEVPHAVVGFVSVGDAIPAQAKV